MLVALALFAAAPGVDAWAAKTHRKATSDAFYIMPPAFRAWLGAPAVPTREYPPCLQSILTACTEPDSVLHDFMNHVYHVHGEKMGNGPSHVESLAKELVNDIKHRAPAAVIRQKLGWLAHYCEDLAQPLHTGVATWDGIEEKSYHMAYEKDVDDTVYMYGVAFDGAQYTSRVGARMVYEALWANQYYEIIERAYSAPDGHELIQAKSATAAAYSRAVNNVVDIWYSVWVAAGGKANPKQDGQPRYYPPYWSYFSAPANTATRVSLNKASLSQLMTVPGVGEKLAAEIIARRPFKCVEELIKVKGVSVTLYRKISARFSL